MAITTIMIRIYCNYLINLITLNILIDLKALNDEPLPLKNINSPRESIEITKSKIFILSIKNSLKPIPINFPIESIENMIVKIELN